MEKQIPILCFSPSYRIFDIPSTAFIIFKGYLLEKMRYKHELLRVFPDPGVFYNCVIGSKEPQDPAA